MYYSVKFLNYYANYLYSFPLNSQTLVNYLAFQSFDFELHVHSEGYSSNGIVHTQCNIYVFINIKAYGIEMRLYDNI